MIFELYKTQYGFFPTLCGTVLSFWILTAHCTWTPEVKTPIYTSKEGGVALQTFNAFKIPPLHPHVFSESLIKQILQDISQNQERGILQELLLSDPQPSPVFTSAQIEFLTPHLVEAFSKATSEELVSFQIQGDEERGVRIHGMVAVFSPTIFFLSLQKTGKNPGKSSKMASSSRHFQEHVTLIFSQKEAMLPQEDIQQLIESSPKEIWIAIDYENLPSGQERKRNAQETRPRTPLPTPQEEGPDPELSTLQEQLEDLQKKVEEQAEEIQRLQHTSPK